MADSTPVQSLASKEAKISVTSTVLGNSKQKGKRIKIRPFVTDTANVSVKAGTTIPTGDYSSVRVDVMISCPCYVEEIPAVFKKTRKLVYALLDKEVERLTEEE